MTAGGKLTTAEGRRVYGRFGSSSLALHLRCDARAHRGSKHRLQRANGQPGDLKTKGVMQLWDADRTALIRAPFDMLTPMGRQLQFRSSSRRICRLTAPWVTPMSEVIADEATAA